MLWIRKLSRVTADSSEQMWTRYLLAFSRPGSKDWHQAGRGSQLLCSSCQNYENKHGCLPRSAAFMFKPVKEEEEVNSKHGMRTRRSRAAVSLAPSNVTFHLFFAGVLLRILTQRSSAQYLTAAVVSEKWTPEAHRLPHQWGSAVKGPDLHEWNILHFSEVVFHGQQERIQQEEEQGEQNTVQ